MIMFFQLNQINSTGQKTNKLAKKPKWLDLIH